MPTDTRYRSRHAVVAVADSFGAATHSIASALLFAAALLAFTALAPASVFGASDRAAAGLRAIGDTAAPRVGDDAPRTEGALSDLSGSTSTGAMSASPSPRLRNSTIPAPGPTKVPLFFGHVEFDWDGDGAGAPGFGPAPGAPATQR
jgi:hypothetical protein